MSEKTYFNKDSPIQANNWEGDLVLVTLLLPVNYSGIGNWLLETADQFSNYSSMIDTDAWRVSALEKQSCGEPILGKKWRIYWERWCWHSEVILDLVELSICNKEHLHAWAEENHGLHVWSLPDFCVDIYTPL